MTETPLARRLWRARRDFGQALNSYHLSVVLLVSGAPDRDPADVEQLRQAFESAYRGFTGELARATYEEDERRRSGDDPKRESNDAPAQ